MTRILLVRHGQSEWNADGRWQGQADPALTEQGIRQADAAAASLGSVDAIVASTLERAHHTAQVIANRLGIEPVITMAELMERHAGEWQGLTRVEIEERYPGFLDVGKRPPGWESDVVLVTRVLVSLDAIAAVVGPDADVVAITHGGVIMALSEHLGGSRERIANLGARWVERQPDGSWLLGDDLDLLHGVDVTVPDQI